jgi:hypothetical protein
MKVEVNHQFKKAVDSVSFANGSVVMFTPPLDSSYWIARVRLFKDQAIVCFPKFGVIGCGLAQEKDWNTNLPLDNPAERIFEHIKHNKKYSKIKDEDCVEAIRLLQKVLVGKGGFNV